MSRRDFDGHEREILSLRNGEFFGEMSLFSGEPSMVTVVASNDLEVMKISAAMVHQMIDRQPSFAREIGQILEIRRAALEKGSQPPVP
jgi:CRP-like cAMP-binding protein